MTKNIVLNEYLVAFVDLLVFSVKVKNINDNNDILKVFECVNFVYDVFGKNPKDDFEIKERELSERSILSLSDALVIATALESSVSETIGVFDNWCSEVNTLGINQAICTANGIFLRGGVSKGQFYFENDILISNAMIRAYETERDVSTYPLICLDEITHKWFDSNKGNDFYADDIKPKDILFKSFPINDEKTVYAIDYFSIGISAASDGFSFEDQQEYSKTSKETKDKVREDIATRNSIKFVNAHKVAIETELKKDHEEKNMKKYLWLKKYHNETILDYFPSHNELLIV